MENTFKILETSITIDETDNIEISTVTFTLDNGEVINMSLSALKLIYDSFNDIEVGSVTGKRYIAVFSDTEVIEVIEAFELV